MTKLELERNIKNTITKRREKIAAGKKRHPIPYDLYQLMGTFMQSDKFDLDMFSKIKDSVVIDYDPIKLSNYVRFLESGYDYDTFKPQIDGCQQYLNGVRSQVGRYYLECLDVVTNNARIKEQTDNCSKLEELIISTELLDNEILDTILKGLDELGFSLETKLAIVAMIVERNSLFMIENPRQIEEPVRVRRRTVVVDEEFEKNKEIIYNISQQQVGEIDELALANELIKKAGYTLEARLDVYNAVFVEDSKDKIEQKISFIIYDLAHNILPAYEKGKIGKKNSKVLFEGIIKLYHKELENLSKAEEREKEQEQIQNLFEEIENVITDTKNKLFTKSYLFGDKYETIFNKLSDLEIAYTSTERITKDKLSSLAHLLKDLKDSMAELEEIKPIVQADHPTNLFIVVNEEELEEDFEILDKAGPDKRGAFLEYIKDHKNKNYNTLDDYLGKTDRSAKLKKKFHIRFHDSKQMHVYYTRCKTTISELSNLFPEYSDVKELILIHKIGPGRTNSTIVSQSVDEAYRRCDKYEAQLDKIMKAFATNWSEATESEKREAIDVITTVIGEQSVILEDIKSKRKGGASNE